MGWPKPFYTKAFFWPDDSSSVGTGVGSLPMVAFGDVDGNIGKEIVFVEIADDFSSTLHVWDFSGTELPGFPVAFPDIVSYPILADIDGDGENEIFIKGM